MLLAQSCRRETTTALEVAVPAPQALLSDAVQELKAWFFSHGRASFKRLKHAHARIVRLRLEQDCYLLNLLLKSLFESGNFRHARLLFDRIPSPNIYLWNTAVRGLVSADQWEEALRLYSLMRREGMCPNNFTFPFVLKACARILELQLGQKVHAHLCKCGLERDVFVKTSLLCLYAKCGHLNHAQALFDEMPEPSVISWTAIITGYMEEGKLEEALGFFTLVRVLCICSQLGDSQAGERIHRYIQEKAMHCNVFVATSLVDMYAKCGDMERARQVFEQMPERDVVTWSTMVAGYSSNGFPRVAVEIARLLHHGGAPLRLCQAGALQLGHSASGLLDRRLFLCNPVLGTALIDMYAKCGDVGTAWAVFRAMESRDLISWNAMISGLAMNGLTKVSFSLFAQLEKSGLRPDGNTFIGLLCSCTHAGMVEEGRRYFHSMASIYSLVPKVEHYGCMVDLLGRSGLLGDARRLIQQMPVEANAVVWGALLSSCRIHRDARMAEDALKRLIELEPRNSGNYVLLSNLYASSGRWRERQRCGGPCSRRGSRKCPFRAGDRSHPLQEEIYAKLEELGKEMKAMGYMPTTEVVMFDVEEEEKEAALGHHSEKLAIAFGLISAAPGDAIRVVKNLRVCADCHAAIKLISKISAREIVVRDNNRFHCFRDGSCSCRDFW
ncbi:unnamed protein product [Spirodela intermedia]|uniref:DYW domain-containing protein n=1 Tax=Spirodela intermedia TaxID=51605 RepID=A0A7I8IAC2_SPIIN|nr:unnamed protein product [Spirodela intermedia]CAA6654676.1 unnamed protein product [Spirodela intermedia]